MKNSQNPRLYHQNFDILSQAEDHLEQKPRHGREAENLDTFTTVFA